MKPEERTVITARIPLELHEDVCRAAYNLDRPVAWVLRQALREWLDRQKAIIKRQGETTKMERGNHEIHT